MNTDTVIKVENLYKKFCRLLKRSMFYGSVDVTRNIINFLTFSIILLKLNHLKPPALILRDTAGF